jgi:hypothetical protein
VFRALPVAVTFLKIEDKGQKVVHVTEGEEIRSHNCHFDSLNLVRNSDLEFEFMHKIRATERA